MKLTDPNRVASEIGRPLEDWALDCHAVSLAIVKAGLVPGGRVARGWCPGVGSQHSWIVDGDDVYDPEAKLIDPTLWSYIDDVPYLWHGGPDDIGHRPHGAGSIWEWGKPTAGSGEPRPLDRTGLSRAACSFLDLIEPLDVDGWAHLVSRAPMSGWPSKEIVTRICEQPDLLPRVPIDIMGMVTDLNPNGLYLADDSDDS